MIPSRVAAVKPIFERIHARCPHRKTDAMPTRRQKALPLPRARQRALGSVFLQRPAWWQASRLGPSVVGPSHLALRLAPPRSPPAQKLLPAPVEQTTRTASSAANAAANFASRSSIICADIALACRARQGPSGDTAILGRQLQRLVHNCLMPRAIGRPLQLMPDPACVIAQRLQMRVDLSGGDIAAAPGA